MTSLEDNKALVRRFWEAFSESRFDDALDLLSDDATWMVAGTTSISGTQSFRERKFNEISCNKIRMVKYVVEECNLDVVFSDVDNIFFHDPMKHDLGKLMLTQEYDYIYQFNRRHDQHG